MIEDSTRIDREGQRVRDVQHLGVLLPLLRQSAARIEKYIANSAAKNMSSLESHTIVPTLTMLGLVSEWIWLLSMAGAAVTRSLLPRDHAARARGVPESGACRGPADRLAATGLASSGAACRNRRPCAAPRPADDVRRRSPPPTLFTADRAGHPGSRSVLLVAAGALPLRRAPAAAARRPLAGRPHGGVLPRAGLGSIAAVTVSGLGAYDTTLLSVHMVQHMVLSMVAPIFLALGAPVTLALRTLPPRPRRVLLAVLHSRVARVLTFPLVAFGLFVANPFVLYFTGLYG